MKPCTLTFTKNENGDFHAVFKNRHARKIYLAISVSKNICTMNECCYIDRSTRKIPKSLTYEAFGIKLLAEKISKELDVTFSEIRFSENEIRTKEENSSYAQGWGSLTNRFQK